MRIAAIILFGLAVVTAQFALKFDLASDGSYGVAVNGNNWLRSAQSGFHVNGKWYSTNQTLSLKSKTTGTGSDKLGQYTQYLLVWVSGQISYYTAIRDYTAHSPILVFIQVFPQALNGTATGDNSQVISAFPSFSLGTSNLHYYTYSGTFLSPKLGGWGSGTNYPHGASSGVPLVLYDAQMNSLVISPLNNFMVGIHSISKEFGGFACGIQGKVKDIPTGFTHSTIITGALGLNNAFNYWGSLLLGYYGKVPAKVDDDFSIKYLGYYTDNGAYYYYNTEPGKNYADTMVDVYNYITETGLPFQYYQLDSWWYFKGATQGLLLWEPRPDIFPNGMKDLQNKMGGKPFVLHNRWFEPDNDYNTKLGFPFVNEKNYALPLNAQPYVYMMTKAKSWGMIVYEQDWLVDQFLNMEATQNNVQLSRNWMINMDSSAQQLDVKIQLCMPLPNHVLQTVEMKQVTQIRASGDYQRTSYIQWNIGYSSIIHHSLGLFPFKDDFWSTNETEPGCGGPACHEPYPQLQALVSTLSCGPVAPADKIGMIDKVNVMSTTRADGVLVKPDVPATTLDIVFSSSFKDNSFFLDPLSHSYSRHSVASSSFLPLANVVTWHYLLAANTDRMYSLLPSDLENFNSVAAGDFIVFDFLAGEKSSLAKFNAQNPLQIPKLPHQGTAANYLYYVIAPSLQVNGLGYSLIGETSKFVTASSQRITGISLSGDMGTVTLTVGLTGKEGEQVGLTVVNSGFKLEHYLCVLSAKGASLVCVDDGKQPKCTCS